MRLYTHQKIAIEKALQLSGNLAIFHDPGLGKTCTTLKIFEALKRKNDTLKLLVVCPKSLLNAAWRSDVAKFTAFRFALTDEKRWEGADIVAVNYERLLSKKNCRPVIDWILRQPTMGALDESSRLKNNKSLTTKLLLDLAPYFKNRLVLSGTPCPNSETELWAQIKFVNQTILPNSFYAFRNIFFHLERNGQVQHGGSYSGMALRELFSRGWKYSITAQNREKLMRQIAIVCDWVKKEDALDLPEKIDEFRLVTLGAKEQKAYNEMKRHFIAEIEQESGVAKQVWVNVALAKTMKLRQCTGGFMYDEKKAAVPLGDTKLKELYAVLEELGPKQAIIWAQFHHEIEMLEYRINRDIAAADTLYANTADKEKSIRDFQNGEIRYLIAHPKSAAHGLTFTNCATQIFYSVDWSYEAYAQARDRTHRIGQTNRCLYIHILAAGTVDEKIMAVLEGKATLEEALNALSGRFGKSPKRTGVAVDATASARSLAV